jgi:L-alanine-DL-glutamate epimerase-like enolase superfamily enzyme
MDPGVQRSPLDAPVTRVEVAAYTIPTDAPESDGTIEWNATTIVVVHATAGGHTGIGFTYAAESAAHLIRDTLAPLLTGRSAMDAPAAQAAMSRACRNIGRPGIAACAISAVDVALWDLKARLLGLPLVTLLGAARDRIPIYGSGGFTSYSVQRLCDQLAGWAQQRIGAVKMKVGRDPDADRARVRAAREAIGPQVDLLVDANGAYSRKQALAQAEAFVEQRITWFEEPVSSDDLEGLRLLRDRMPAPIEVAAGEYGYDIQYFRRMLAAGAVDVLQADATRCGGVTGFQQAAALCDAWGLPLSSHTAPSIHAHVCCAAERVRHLEYFHDHARIESLLFDGALPPVDGALRPDRSCVGLGIELKRRDAERFAA